MSSKQSRSIRRRMAGSYLSALISMSLVLLLVGVSSLLMLSIPSLEKKFADNLHITLLLKDKVSAVDGISLKDRLLREDYVRGARYVSRQQGEEELEALLGEGFLDVFETSPVPVSIELTLPLRYYTPDSLRVVESRLSRYSSYIEEVDVPQVLAAGFGDGLKQVVAVGLSLALLLLFISIVLISSMLRLSLFSKRFTIHTMLLVGATRPFIARPYVRKAVGQGALSALLAMSLIALGLFFVWRVYPQIVDIISLEALAISAGGVLLLGIGICLISAEVIVGKICSLDAEELYG